MPKGRSNHSRIRRLSDLTLDPHNANLGTTRGREALAHSLRELGAGRAVVIDRRGHIIAEGNARVSPPARSVAVGSR
jgi:hypothetical protein